MADKVKIEDFAASLGTILDEYSDTVIDATNEAAEEAGKFALSRVKELSPVRTGRYKRGWTKAVVTQGAGSIVVTIYNKRPYLPHLLENGHAKVNGGRVKALPHIAPAEKEAIENFEREIKIRIGGG